MKALILILLLSITTVIYADSTESTSPIDDEVTSDGIDIYNESQIPSILFCNAENKPTLIKSIEKWEVVSGNIAYIDTANYFSGAALTFSIDYQQTDPANVIKFNQKSGDLEIHAEARENINIKITAKNSCGSVSSTFNVVIDEED